MKKYKVEIVQKTTYIIDVLAKDEDTAKILAETKWNTAAQDGIHHYHEIDQSIDFGTTYDVTHTDDPFNP